MVELQNVRPGMLIRFPDDPDHTVYERRAGRRIGSRMIHIRPFGGSLDVQTYAERQAEFVPPAEAADLREAAGRRPPVSVIGYEYPTVRSGVLAWIDADAPDSYTAPDYPPFSAVAVVKGGMLTVERWRASSASVAGSVWSGYHLLCVYATNLRKNGELRADWINRAEEENVKDAVRAAHAGWMAAGRPAEFVYYC
jgi:hypothetical protein